MGLILAVVAMAACSRGEPPPSTRPRTGTWQADWVDSAGVRHERFLTSRPVGGASPRVTMDEPSEDWYDVPVDVTERRGAVCLALWWGLETLCGTFGNDATFAGMRAVAGVEAPFSYPRLAIDSIQAFARSGAGRIDAADHGGYRYQAPEPANDGLRVGSLSDTDIDMARIAALGNAILDGAVQRIHSVLVAVDGELVVEEYFFGYRRDRSHRLHSATKSFTSALIGIAIEEGHIGGVEDLVEAYFPGYEDTPWVRDGYPITIGHLLAMTAGLRWQPLTTTAPDIMAMYASPDPVAYMFGRDLAEPPGSRFFYNDGNSVLLGRILEVATGMTVESHASRVLFEPLGIADPPWDRMENGIVRTDGGLRLRPRDMVKFGLVYLNGGRWEGRQVVPEGWVDASFGSHTPPGQQPYGYQWWIRDVEVNRERVRTFTATGHGGQFIFVIPDLRMVAVFTAGNYFQSEDLPLHLMREYVLPAFQRATSP